MAKRSILIPSLDSSLKLINLKALLNTILRIPVSFVVSKIDFHSLILFSIFILKNVSFRLSSTLAVTTFNFFIYISYMNYNTSAFIKPLYCINTTLYSTFL